MQNEILQGKLESLKDRLQMLCYSNELECTVINFAFPIVITINPEIGNQLTIDNEQRDSNSIKMKIIFGEELSIEFIGGFTINESLLSKIKNLCKKLHYAYLQLFFAEQKR